MANTANIKAVITAEDHASSVLKGFGNKVESLGQDVLNVAKRTSIALGAITTGAVAFGIKTAGNLESARQGFVTLLGSAQAADDVINQIKKDAAQTPFELAGLIEANQALTAVTKNGVRSEKVLLDVGKALAASGKGQAELDRIIANLQQIGLTGKITEMDVRQFGMSGVNILELLAESYGVTTAEASEMVKESKDAFGDLEKAFAKAGGAGGKFENSFKNQAGTFNQLVSNMKDSFSIFVSDFVKETGIFDLAKRGIDGLTDAVTNNKDALVQTTRQIATAVVPVLQQWAKNIAIVAKQVAEYLGPKLSELWNTIEQNLLPTLVRLWKEVLEPLAPIIGTVLVFAVGALIDALKLLLDIYSILTNAVLDFKDKVVIAWNFVSDFIANVKEWFNGLPEPLRQAMSGIADILIGPFKTAFEFIRAGVEDVKNSVNEIKQGGGGIGGGILKGLFRSVTKIPFFASGTDYAPGGPAIVGERGPELINLPRGSQVIPNNQMGGSTINVSFSGIFTGNQQEFRKLAIDVFKAYDDAKGMGTV